MKLNNAQDAIKQAIEGGLRYVPKVYGDWFMLSGTDLGATKEMADGFQIPVERILCDPLFWQALGKVRGKRQWMKWAMDWFATHLENDDETKFWQSLP